MIPAADLHSIIVASQSLHQHGKEQLFALLQTLSGV
jgi:hypothetical protein